MTTPTEAEIRAAHASEEARIVHEIEQRKGPVLVHQFHVDRRELLRLLDEARAERDELRAHEKQTHESLEVCASRMRAERDALREPARLFGELMAVMHSDGGHYRAEHGDQKAYDDAVARWYAVITERDGARALAEQHQRQIAALEAAVRNLTAEADANRRDAERWRAQEAERLRMRMMAGDPRQGVSGGSMPDTLSAIPRNDAMKEPSRD